MRQITEREVYYEKVKSSILLEKIKNEPERI